MLCNLSGYLQVVGSLVVGFGTCCVIYLIIYRLSAVLQQKNQNKISESQEYWSKEISTIT
jgi:hypothetical protein